MTYKENNLVFHDYSAHTDLSRPTKYPLTTLPFRIHFFTYDDGNYLKAVHPVIDGIHPNRFSGLGFQYIYVDGSKSPKYDYYGEMFAYNQGLHKENALGSAVIGFICDCELETGRFHLEVQFMNFPIRYETDFFQSQIAYIHFYKNGKPVDSGERTAMALCNVLKASGFPL